MRFLIDENTPSSVARALVSLGHDVRLSTDLVGAGAPDPQVALGAIEDDRILVTCDQDFRKIDKTGSEAQRKRFQKLGRIWLQCRPEEAATRLSRYLCLVSTEVSRLAKDSPENGCFVSLQNDWVRIRVPPSIL